MAWGVEKIKTGQIEGQDNQCCFLVNGRGKNVGEPERRVIFLLGDSAPGKGVWGVGDRKIKK